MHVLHLEDESPLREILKVALMAAQPTLNLKQYINSDEAVKYIAEHVDDIDLFILDIRVPGSMDGMAVAKKIRELGCPGVIAITSAYQQPRGDVLDTLKALWLPKPWHIMDVLEKLLPMIRSK